MAKKPITIRLEEKLLERIEEMAKKENRPISNYIETVLKKHLEEKEKSR